MLRNCQPTRPPMGDLIGGCRQTLVPIPNGRGYVCPNCDGPVAAAIDKKKKGK